MKKWIIMSVFAAFVVAALGSYAWAGGGSQISHNKQSGGTRTVRFTMDADTLTDAGANYLDDSAMVTPWVEVPVGVSFYAMVECRDADSSITFTADTIHIVLQTAPSRSFAVDSSGTLAFFSRYKAKVVNLHHFSTVGWSSLTKMRAFPRGQGMADTTSDTVVVVAASLSSGPDNVTSNLPTNLGNLRFLFHMDANDNITDGSLRMAFYIVWHESLVNDGRSYGAMFGNGKEYACLDVPKTLQEYANMVNGVRTIRVETSY